MARWRADGSGIGSGVLFRRVQSKTPQSMCRWGVFWYKSLTMTYFHRRTSTIIGAKAFHGPVRDGKGWGHLAMVVKRNGLPGALLGARAWANLVRSPAARFGGRQQLGNWGIGRYCVYGFAMGTELVSPACCAPPFSCGAAAFTLFERHLNTHNLQGYRIKPHGQLVLVSCAHYCAYTPSLSTSWSRTTLQGGLAPGIPNLQTSFPLRCLQRLSLPYVATRQCHWHDNRYTSGTSTPVLSY